jgi:hypothetical protein
MSNFYCDEYILPQIAIFDIIWTKISKNVGGIAGFFARKMLM